ALANPASNLAAHVAELTSALERHLKHEEDAALPLIQAVCTPADWRAFTGEMRRRQGLKGAAIYVPWILDGTAPAGRRRFLAALPAPVRVISRLLWDPRYSHRVLLRACRRLRRVRPCKPWAVSMAPLHGQTPLPGWPTWVPGHLQAGLAALRDRYPRNPPWVARTGEALTPPVFTVDE